MFVAPTGRADRRRPWHLFHETLLASVAQKVRALTNLGISTFAQTILDDPDAATVRATIGLVLADAAAMEAETAGRVVTADLLVRSPVASKYWSHMTQSGGTYTEQASFNSGGFSDNGVGNIQMGIGTDFSSANWASATTAETGAATASISSGGKTAGALAVDLRIASTGASTDVNFSVVGFGDQ